MCSAGTIYRALFFLQRGFGENIDFGPFFQFEKNLGWEPGLLGLRVNRKPSSHRPPSVYDLRFDVNRKPHVNQ